MRWTVRTWLDVAPRGRMWRRGAEVAATVAPRWQSHIGSGRRRLGSEFAGDRLHGGGCEWCCAKEEVTGNGGLTQAAQGHARNADGEVRGGGANGLTAARVFGRCSGDAGARTGCAATM